MLRFILCFGLASLTAFAAGAPPKTRLAEVQSVEPASYRAELTLDPEKNTFSGTIVIRMKVRKPTDTLWLNQEKIAIQSAVFRAGGKQLTATMVPGGEDFVGLHFDAPLPAGDAEATIRYTGVVVEKNSIAIFRQQESGNWYIFSQFEATDARGAFPCFDEPSYKTPWQLTLHIPQSDSAISNTPVASETRGAGGVKTLVFKETKPLPSYLVAFAVGPFEYVDAGTVGKAKVPIRIVVPKGKSGEAKYAAEVTAPILNRLEAYFGIPFPYEKSDQVAVPDTSGWGAMENPGMVTYQQNIILADPKVDRLVRQRQYVQTAAHELAHQWFGDLVTTAWWDDIWLNESFATWMERKIVAEWKPEWDTRVVDVTEKLGVEREDSLLSARRIRQPIVTKDDINNAFDGITYEKGAAVIGMFENWMGPEEFRKGVQGYLKRYAFHATTAGDFLDALSSSSQRNVTTAFSTFLNQAGAPLVSVALDCKGPKPALVVSQKRFVPLGSKDPAPQTWNVPLCIRYGSGTSGRKQCTVVTQPTQTVTLEAVDGCPAWVQANDGASGYYHVAYAPGMLAALTTGDVPARLPATERADLMGNAQSLASAGLLPVADSLTLVAAFHDDPTRNVLELALDTAVGLRRSVPANLMANYQRFMVKSFGDRARRLGWTPQPGESEDTRLERPAVLRAMATAGGDAELAAEARALTEKWFADHATLSSDLRNAVLASAAYSGDKALFDRFLTAFRESKDRQVRASIIQAMYWMREPATIEAAMMAVVNGDVPFIEGARLVVGPQRDVTGAKQAFELVKAHFEQIVEKMPTGGGFDFGSVLPEVGGPFCDAQSRDDLKAFFAPKVSRFSGAPRALDQVVEAIDLCIARRAAQAESVAAFLGKY
jgi:alanyl aminopeptidase